MYIATSKDGTATRKAWSNNAPKWQISIPLKLPSWAKPSALCWKTTVIVRQIIVNTWPAAASGIAIAIPAPILWWPAITRIVEITEASAASGAIAAPIFIQPSAIISKVPPIIMPVVISPKIAPTNVHAINGRCVWNSSRTLPIPAIAETIKIAISCTPLSSIKKPPFIRAD